MVSKSSNQVVFCAALPLLVVLNLPLAARANEMQTFLALNAERSDNALLTSSGDGLSEIELRPAIRIDYLLDYSALTANLNYSASQSRFQNETFEDRTELLGTGTARVTISDNLLYWSFFQNSSRLTLDSLVPLTPANETRRDVIRTGPELNWSLGARTRLQLGANYIASTFESGSQLETDQRQFSANLSQQLSTRTSIALNYERSDADSEVEVLKYKSKRYGLTLSGVGRSYEYSLNGGRNIIDRASGSSVSGAFYAGTFSLNLARTNLWLSGTRELTDSSIGLSLGASTGAAQVNNDANFAAQDIVLRERFEAVLTRELVKGAVSIGAVYDSQDYQVLTRDEVDHSYYLSIQYPLTERWSLRYKRDWKDATIEQALNLSPDEFLDRNDVLDFVFRPNTKTQLKIGFVHNERSHVLPAQGFKEFVVTLMIERKI